MKTLLALLVLSTLLVSCGTSPQPIEYGHMSCDFCKMTVVDQRYAAQLVTTKGKSFVFDAAECLINYTNTEENKRHEFSHILVTDYLTPAKLINAKTASFIRSEQLPSPMGAFITSVEKGDDAKALKDENGGMIYSWDALNNVFAELPTFNHDHQN
jgi:copper chaperone NosL